MGMGIGTLLGESPKDRERRTELALINKSNPEQVKVLIDNTLLAINMNASMLSVQQIHDHMAKYLFSKLQVVTEEMKKIKEDHIKKRQEHEQVQNDLMRDLKLEGEERIHQLQVVTEEMKKIKEDHIKKRQEHEQIQNELMRDLKLKKLIIENFIPPEEKEKFIRTMVFDEEEECWKKNPVTQDQQMMCRPRSAVGYRRPICRHARRAMIQKPDAR
ncbi:hypothetical protein OJAV_G00085740 [Oryzias javanicus]|uniref:Uncharacterized protein n=1 Tax=Oryzias javanicus TaxID=123683 RepID=A0A437CYM2_ORYJA|nr:hypothetical protein OJAV_G00085740 [Oryzias javanicus]